MKVNPSQTKLEVPADSGLVEQQILADVSRLLTFAVVMLLGVHVSLTLFPPNPVGLALQLLFVASLVLALNRWTAVIIFALAQVPLFLATLMRWNPEPSLDEVLVALQLILIVAMISRLHSPAGTSFSTLKTLKMLFRKHDISATQREQSLAFAAEAVRQFLISTFLLVGSMLAVVLLAAFVLQLIPMDYWSRASSQNWSLIKPSWFRLIVLSALLFVCVLFTWIIVAEVNFRRLSVREASMYLRSQLLGWLHRDFRMVVRKHRRKKRKKS
ncbi:MAG: hypothetical protein ABJZ55_06610 [Fuerstiella sp.]